jgi:hypothetical protein
MAKKQKTEISVTTVFDGKQDGRQAFVELILQKRRSGKDSTIDAGQLAKYNQNKVFSDVRVG